MADQVDTYFATSAAGASAQLANMFAGLESDKAKLADAQSARELNMLQFGMEQDASMRKDALARDALALEQQRGERDFMLRQEENAYTRLNATLDRQLTIAEGARKDRDAAFERSLKALQNDMQAKSQTLMLRGLELQMQKAELEAKLPAFEAEWNKADMAARKGDPIRGLGAMEELMTRPEYTVQTPQAKQAMRQHVDLVTQVAQEGVYDPDTMRNMTHGEYQARLKNFDPDKPMSAGDHQLFAALSAQYGVRSGNDLVQLLRGSLGKGSTLARKFESMGPRLDTIISAGPKLMDPSTVVQYRQGMMQIEKLEAAFRESPAGLAALGDKEKWARHQAGYEDMKHSVLTGVTGTTGPEATNLLPRQVDPVAHVNFLIDAGAQATVGPAGDINKIAPGERISFRDKYARAVGGEQMLEQAERVKAAKAEVAVAYTGAGDLRTSLNRLQTEFTRLNALGDVEGGVFWKLGRGIVRPSAAVPEGVRRLTMEQIIPGSVVYGIDAKLDVIRKRNGGQIPMDGVSGVDLFREIQSVDLFQETYGSLLTTPTTPATTAPGAPAAPAPVASFSTPWSTVLPDQPAPATN